ncbi:MAG: glycyl-radical enzyme activating protein [Desulfobacteraceae bacterium]|nr:glycyl-radical enzyme activating protein [Desulfobacteraceae bacterium]
MNKNIKGIKEERGVVFNIQRFSTHDGPGIRTTVFLKGCPLTCLWCSNPESQKEKPQLMVRDIKCSGCGACLSSCPEQAISFSKKRKRIINWEKCNNCFSCVDACLYKALTAVGVYKSVEEIVEVVEKDRIFYENSKGGVTFSGGEVLTQHNFLEKLLIRFKEEGIHRTVDTTGLASLKVVKKIIPLTDLVMIDIKHLNSKKHKEGTGVGNELILSNLEYIAKNITTWIRLPLIPGFNDDQDHILKIAQLATRLNVEKISLLPYHEGGRAKAAQIGETFEQEEMETQSDEHLKRLTDILSKRDIKITVSS